MLFLAEVQNTSTIFFSGLAGLVAAIGIVASIKAALSIKQETNEIQNAEDKLLPNEAWLGAYQHEKQGLVNWFQELNIRQHSGVGDVISACWAAFQGGRSVSLTEIHVLAARRERSKWEVKLSGGIIGLLLVIGIVGTLFSIHPVLTEFKFNVSDSAGDEKLVNVADSTEVVNSLMRNLGNAFLPSLWALCGTVVVATVRGFYSRALNKYTLELDRFAIWTVIPRFRPNSISEEYEIVRQSFDGLAKAIARREDKFDILLNNLTQFVTGTEKTLAGLEYSITRINGAAEALTDRTGSIGESLMKTLGRNSPLLGVITGYEDIFNNANEQMEALAGSVSAFIKSNQRGGKSLETSAEKFADAIQSVANTHDEDRKVLAKLLADIVKERNQERDAFVAATEKISYEQRSAKDAIDGALAGLSEMSTALPAKLEEVTRQALDQQLHGMKESMADFIDSSTNTISKNSDGFKNDITLACGEIRKQTIRDSQTLMTLVSQLPDSVDARLARNEEALKDAVNNLNGVVAKVAAMPQGTSDSDFSSPNIAPLRPTGPPPLTKS